MPVLKCKSGPTLSANRKGKRLGPYPVGNGKPLKAITLFKNMYILYR